MSELDLSDVTLDQIGDNNPITKEISDEQPITEEMGVFPLFVKIKHVIFESIRYCIYS